MEEQIGFFDFMDLAVAEVLGVDVEEYIRVIEGISEIRSSSIIQGLMSDDKGVVDRAKRIFFMCASAQPPKC
jgi:hypothetical protein